MNRDEHLDELLGAYALDAVDDDERRRVERYLAEHPDARAEVWQMRQAAAMLTHSGEPAPDGVWDRIAATMEEQPPRLTSVIDAGRRRRRSPRTILATAALIIAAVAGFVIAGAVDDARSPTASEAIEQAFAEARDDPDWQLLDLRSGDGELRVEAVLRSDGTGLISATELPELAASETYQLWGIYEGGDVISLGVVGNRPHIEPFAASGALDALAITREAAGGVVAPTDEPLVVGSVDRSA